MSSVFRRLSSTFQVTTGKKDEKGKGINQGQSSLKSTKSGETIKKEESCTEGRKNSKNLDASASFVKETEEPKRVWRSARDPKSGRIYYYDVVTRETQWNKPMESSPEIQEESNSATDKNTDQDHEHIEPMNCVSASTIVSSDQDSNEAEEQDTQQPSGDSTSLVLAPTIIQDTIRISKTSSILNDCSDFLDHLRALCSQNDALTIENEALRIDKSKVKEANEAHLTAQAAKHAQQLKEFQKICIAQCESTLRDQQKTAEALRRHEATSRQRDQSHARELQSLTDEVKKLNAIVLSTLNDYKELQLQYEYSCADYDRLIAQRVANECIQLHLREQYDEAIATNAQLLEERAQCAALQKELDKMLAEREEKFKNEQNSKKRNYSAYAGNYEVDSDLPEPKKPRTAVRCFMRRNVRKLREKYPPDTSNTELKRILTEMFRQAPPDVHAEMKRLAEKDKARYEKELRDRNNTGNDGIYDPHAPPGIFETFVANFGNPTVAASDRVSVASTQIGSVDFEEVKEDLDKYLGDEVTDIDKQMCVQTLKGLQRSYADVVSGRPAKETKTDMEVENIAGSLATLATEESKMQSSPSTGIPGSDISSTVDTTSTINTLRSLVLDLTRANLLLMQKVELNEDDELRQKMETLQQSVATLTGQSQVQNQHE